MPVQAERSELNGRLEGRTRMKMRVALETGTHSAWVTQFLADLGHEVILANAGQIPVITGRDKKTDANNAENLLRSVPVLWISQIPVFRVAVQRRPVFERSSPCTLEA